MGGKNRRPSSAKNVAGAFLRWFRQYFVRRRIKFPRSVTNSESGHNISLLWRIVCEIHYASGRKYVEKEYLR